MKRYIQSGRLLKLSEWGEVLQYAKELAAKASKDFGVDVRASVYTMYDGAKGISFKVYDSDGNFYQEYNSGIQSSVADYKRALQRCYNWVRTV